MATVIDNLTWAKQQPTTAFGNTKGTPISPSPKKSIDAVLHFVVTHTGIDVKLSNSITVSALRFEIEFERRFKYKPPELSARIQNLNNYINFQDNTLTFVLLGVDSKGIASGNGTIITIPFDREQEFRVVSAYASSTTSGIAEIEYSVSDDDSGDGTLVLEQNDPNPFSATTKIEFEIADKTNVKLVIYDVGGALVRTLLDSSLEAGVHKTEWDGKDDSGQLLDSGIYLYKLYAGVYSITRKMVFLR